jgi:hypothetical protein
MRYDTNLRSAAWMQGEWRRRWLNVEEARGGGALEGRSAAAPVQGAAAGRAGARRRGKRRGVRRSTIMLVEDFINRRKASWERLSAIVERSRRGGLAALEDEEIAELGRLYRSATSDLAVARRDFSGHRVVDYLNGLVARAHAEVYQRRADRSSGLVRYFATDLPRTFRETWVYSLASLLHVFDTGADRLFCHPERSALWIIAGSPASKWSSTTFAPGASGGSRSTTMGALHRQR